MCNPMFFDMASGTPWGSFNLFQNQMMEHSIAMQKLYFNPSRYSYCNFTPYGNASMDLWSIPCFNPWNYGAASLNSYNQNYAQDMFNPWNRPPYLPSTPGNSNTELTEEEKIEEEKYRLKYNRILTLIKNLKETGKITEEEKIKLRVAETNTTGTTKEKFERLVAALEAIPASKVKKFLTESVGVGVVTKDDGTCEDKDSFYERLQNAGFEYTNKTTDDKVKELFKEIEKLNDKDPIGQNGTDFVAGINSVSILDFISSWNSNYATSNTDTDKRAILHMANRIKQLSKDTQRESAFSTYVEPLVEQLIREARVIKEDLPEETQTEMDSAIKALENELERCATSWKEKSKNVDGQRLSDNFDKLYLLTRKASMHNIRKSILENYGNLSDKLSNNIFNDNLFVDEEVKDLKEEGFKVDQINAYKTKIKEEEEIEEENDLDNDAGNEAGKVTGNQPGAKNVKETEEEEGEKEIETSEQIDAKAAIQLGETVAEKIRGYTYQYEYTKACEILNRVNSSNVMHFLAGYKNEKNWTGYSEPGGFFINVIEETGDPFKEASLDSPQKVLKHMLELVIDNLKIEQNIAKEDNSTQEWYLTQLETDIANLEKILNNDGEFTRGEAMQIENIIKYYIDKAQKSTSA